MKRLIPLLLVATAGLGFALPQGSESIHVSTRRLDGELLVSVTAADKPLDRVIAEVADEAGLALSGFDGRRQRLVTVELHDRPLDMVLEFVLGSVGLEFELEGNHLAVLGHEGADRATLLRSAKRSYQRALNTFPSHTEAPRAYLSQAWIAEHEGDLGSAIRLYQTIPTAYPNYPQLAAAQFHTGRLKEELGNWRDAVQHYDIVSELRTDHDFHGDVRLGQARCKIALGDPAGAIYLLQSLELASPAFDDEEAAGRILVRAKAHNALRDYQATLADLDQIDQLRSYLVTTADYLRCTAVALEGLGLYGPAGRAWLALAERTDGTDRLTAVELAIELFLDADDDTSALYAARFGRELGGTPKLEALEDVVAARLGLDTLGEESPEVTDAPLGRLEQAREAWNRDDLAGAYTALSPLITDPRGLTESDHTDALGLWARCLEQLEGLEVALGVLRDARPELEALENRMRLDVLAAELYEAHGMFDEAVDAYGGTYR